MCAVSPDLEIIDYSQMMQTIFSRGMKLYFDQQENKDDEEVLKSVEETKSI